MPYLIDSDWAIDYLAGDPEALQFLERLAEEGIAISAITYMEVYQGTERSADPRQAQARLQAFMDNVPVLLVTLSTAQGCAQLRETLRRQGKRVNQRALDLIIAATALEHNLTLVTRNTDDFQDVPGLMLYREN